MGNGCYGLGPVRTTNGTGDGTSVLVVVQVSGVPAPAGGTPGVTVVTGPFRDDESVG